MLNIYPNCKSAAAAAPSSSSAVLRKLLLLFILVPLILLAKAQQPVITSFHPDSARQSDTVFIIGAHFTGTMQVQFGGTAAGSFTVFSDSLLQAVVGAGSSGPVKVTNPHGLGVSTGFFTFISTTPPPPPVAPHLISFTPHSAAQWDTVLLKGTHLSQVNAVSFGGVAAHSFSILSDSALWAIVGAGASGKVKVFSAAGSDSLSGFTFVLSTSPIPHILSFTPDSARRNDTVFIRGYRFTGATAVSFGGVAARSFTVLSDTLIRATVDSGATGYVKVVHLSFSDSLGGFIFIPAPPVTLPPVINAFAPLSGTTGTVVTITGTHFTGTTQVLFGGTNAAAFTVQSDTSISAIVGAGSTGAVKVFTHGGLAVAAAVFGFTAPPPPVTLHIVSFFPDSARQGDTVRITGIHFDSVSLVRLGNVPARSFTIVSDSLIWATVGAGASGFVTVSTSTVSDSLGGFVFITTDTTTPPPPPPPSSFELLSFTGASVSGHALLSWKVLHDQSIFFYSAEHSADTVSAHFSSTGGVISSKQDSASYSFTDTTTRSGINYYRLRIIDTIGGVTLSPTVAIDFGTAPGTLTVYPNPAAFFITSLVPVTTVSSKFVLTDASGHVVLTVPVRAGVTQVSMAVSRFNRGIYKLVWSNGKVTAAQTILILR